MVRLLILAFCSAGCRASVTLPPSPEVPDGDDTPVDEPLDTVEGPPVDTTEPLDPSCDRGEIGKGGGVLAIGGAVLEVPGGALDDIHLVELCLVTEMVNDLVSDVIEVRPLDLALDLPLILRLDHQGDPLATSLFTPGLDGLPVRQLLAVTEPSFVEGPMFRAGQAWAATDPRVLVPYDVGEGAVADLLVVVDNSCSMADEQAQLADNFPVVFDAFVASGLDYHVGVTTADLDSDEPGSGGSLVDVDGVQWIDPSTVDADSTFAAMVQLGPGGSSLEQGLGAAYLALDGRNPGFLRDGAQLGVLVLSDEDDTTAPSLVTVADFVTWFDALRPLPEFTRFHSIVTPGASPRYLDVTAQVGGSSEDIGLANWSAMLTGIVADFELLLGMTLAPPAIDGTVEVWILFATPEEEPVRIDPALITFDPATQQLVVPPSALPSAADGSVWVLYEAAP